MRRMINLNMHGYGGRSLRPGVYPNLNRVISVILLVSFFFVVYCTVLASVQDLKGVRILEVKKNGKRIILYEGSYALLIGISQYKYNCWPPLTSVPKEIRNLESILKKRGFIIQTLLNPTSKVLKEAVDKFISNNGLDENNRLLIFFSGHGYTRKDGEKGYIVPADAQSPEENENDFVNNAIEMEQILTWAKKIESKHALFVFDSCFSGTIFQTRCYSHPPPVYITYLAGKPVRQFITAGGAGEQLPAKSIFSPCFIKGLEGEADDDRDGYITGTELGLYLQKKLINYKIDQTPQVGKIRDPHLDQGDFVFKAPKQVPEPGGNVFVYITKYGRKYHREHCSYLKKSKIKIRLSEAKRRDYKPCKVCKPPK